jgi:predicted transcriptional regulator
VPQQTETQPAFLHALVDPNLRERLEQLAIRNDRSLAAEIRRAVAAHIERESHPIERGRQIERRFG